MLFNHEKKTLNIFFSCYELTLILFMLVTSKFFNMYRP